MQNKGNTGILQRTQPREIRWGDAHRGLSQNDQILSHTSSDIWSRSDVQRQIGPDHKNIPNNVENMARSKLKVVG